MPRVNILLFFFFSSASGHAILTNPVPRAGTNIGSGIKLQPFADARTIANGGCGGVANRDPGTTAPITTYQSGATIQVEWKLTIPHPADNLADGVRVALHVAAADSFDQNILAGGVAGDPPYTKVPAGDDGDASNAVKTVTVTLPPGKTCDLCTLQWMWSAQADGGSYIGCADVSITTTGQPPTVAPIPVQGEVLAGVPGEVFAVSPPAGSPSVVQYYPPPPPLGAGGQELDSPEKSGGISGMTMAGVVIVIALAYGGYSFNKAKKEAAAGGVTLTAGDWAKAEAGKVQAKVQAEMEKRKGANKPKGPPAQMAAVPPPAVGAPGYTAPDALPEQWQEMKDPSSGAAYFYNTRTGSSSWVRPTA